MARTARRTAVGVLALAAGIVPVLAWAGTAAPLVRQRLFLAPNQLVAARPGGPPSTTFPISYDGNYYGWISSNWSGYAVTGSYHSVHAEWTVPEVAPSHPATYSAAWTGIDGFQNSSLIQTGTEQDFYGGAAHDSAWWTTSTAGFAEQVITSSSSGCSGPGTCGAVAAGDSMTATIARSTSSNQWTITLSDLTEDWAFTTTATYSGPGESAEWIVEAPALSPNGVGFHQAALAGYGTVTFDKGTVNGSSPNLLANSSTSDAGLLVPHDGHVASVPSSPDGDKDGFANAYGSTAPSPPAS